MQGVVRIHLLEGRDLVAKDTYMMGLVQGKSDPYAILRVGNRHFKSKTIKENLYPKWNEVYEVEPSSGVQRLKPNTFVSYFLHLRSLLSMKRLDKSWRWSYTTRTRIKTTLWEGWKLWNVFRNVWLLQLGSRFQALKRVTFFRELTTFKRRILFW